MLLTLLFRDTIMSEIGPRLIPRFSFYPGHLPLGTRGVQDDACVVLVRSRARHLDKFFCLPTGLSTTIEIACGVTSPCDALGNQDSLPARSRDCILIEHCVLATINSVLRRFTFNIYARVITSEMSTQAVVDATLRCMAPKVGDCGHVFCESFDETNINRLPDFAILTYNRVCNMLTNDGYFIWGITV